MSGQRKLILLDKRGTGLSDEVDVRHVLPSIRVPTLIIHRRQDALLPAESAGLNLFPARGDYLKQKVARTSKIRNQQ
jgi:pimeloyl-ACP methyl ester carboxylesterase